MKIKLLICLLFAAVLVSCDSQNLIEPSNAINKQHLYFRFKIVDKDTTYTKQESILLK